MHFLHIFNTCTVTDLRYGGKEKNYYTKDYKIELNCIKKAPNALYRLNITTRHEMPSVLDNIPTRAGSKVFVCDGYITAENESVLCLCGVVADNPIYKIVMNKTFCI